MRHQRRQEQRLGVLEVLVEDVGDVLGGEPHEFEVYWPRAYSALPARYTRPDEASTVRAGFHVSLRRGNRRAVGSERRPRAREIYKQLIEINTTDTPAGTSPRPPRRWPRGSRRPAFAAADVQLLGPSAEQVQPRRPLPRHRRASGRCCCSRTSTSSKRSARTGRRDPFMFLEKDGYFYGRGTSDDKAMASHFVANLIRLKEEGFKPDRDLILALTADEEGGDFNGARLAGERTIATSIDAEFAINEGGGGEHAEGQVPDQRGPGEREGLPGLQARVTQLRRAQLAAGQGQRHLSPRAGAGAAGGVRFPGAAERDHAQLLRALGGGRAAMPRSPPTCAPWPAPRRIRGGGRALSAKLPYCNAMMRTTCVATRLEGGHANNALPQLARANVNCRILPGESPSTSEETMVDTLCAIPKISVVVRRRGEAERSRRRSRPDVMSAVESLTKAMFPGVIVVPVMSTGATDGLYLRNAGHPDLRRRRHLRRHGRHPRARPRRARRREAVLRGARVPVPADQGALEVGRRSGRRERERRARR